MKKYKRLALAAAVLTAGFLSFGGAQAATVMTGNSAPAVMTDSSDGNIQLAAHRYWRHGGHGGNWSHHRGGSGVFLGFGLPLVGGPYYDDYYDDYGYGYDYGPPRAYYAPVGGSHVRWCMNRYRSYDPRTNTFMGYDGDRHLCRSPYRY